MQLYEIILAKLWQPSCDHEGKAGQESHREKEEPIIVELLNHPWDGLFLVRHHIK